MVNFHIFVAVFVIQKKLSLGMSLWKYLCFKSLLYAKVVKMVSMSMVVGVASSEFS